MTMVPTLLILASCIAGALSGCSFQSADQAGGGIVLTSISVQPASIHMMAGTTQQFMAIGTYSDNTSRDVTSLVTWESLEPSRATVSNEQGTAGIVTALDGGALEISASSGGVSSTARVAVLSIAIKLAKNPFVRMAVIRTDGIDEIRTIDYRIYTKTGNLSKDINFSYSVSYLDSHAYVDNITSTVSIPIVGLYANYVNKIAVQINLKTGESLNALLQIQTDPYADDRALVDTVVTQKYLNPNTSFILLDTQDAPTILDIDGEIRWQFNKRGENIATVHIDNDTFIAGDAYGRDLFRIDFLGEVISSSTIPDTRYSRFTPNFDAGKQGIFGPMQYKDGMVTKIGSVLVEFSPQAEILRTWDFDEIIGGAIKAAGEDSSKFIMDNVDWFHINSSAYSARDDGIIVSSRENFVVKIDYSTKQIRWILGNPEKMWFKDFPLGLQPLALKTSGKVPIGQHSVSIVGSDELTNQFLLLLNNGFGNQALPYIGDNRTYSTVSLYEINEAAMTATEVWTFDANQEIYSPICGSVYKTAANDFLIDFAAANGDNNAIIMVVDANKILKFSMKIPKRAIDPSSCNMAYRAREIKLEKMQLY
jgi:arylsulfate sulfotransferase